MKLTAASTILALLALTAAAAFAADPPVVGEVQTFWIWDLSVMPPVDAQIEAQCVGVSDHAYIFVETDRLGEFSQEAADTVLTAFDEATPDASIDPESGIFQIETDNFGPLTTDRDELPGVFLLYYEIGDFEGYTFDGYFRATDLTDDPTSNHREMLHLNIVDRDPASDYMLGVVAHEFSHLINTPKDPTETGWLSETLGEAAMVLTGYLTDLIWVQDYADNPGVASLFGDENKVHYGAVFLFGTYLYENFGAEGLTFLSDDPADGVSSVDELVYEQWGMNFEEFFSMWALANLIDDPDTDYGYALIDVPELDAEEEVALADAPDVQIRASAGAMSFAAVDVAAGDRAALTSDGVDGADSDVYAVLMNDAGVFGEPLSLPSAKADTLDEVIECPEDGSLFVILINPNQGPAASLTFHIEQAPPDDDDATDDDVYDDDFDDDAADDDIAGDEDDDDDDDDDDNGGCGC